MAKGKVVAKAKTRACVRKRPVKAGRTMPKNIGGVANVKIVATVKKIKSQKNG